MSSIKKTGARPPPMPRSNISSCGPATPTERAISSCGGWVTKSTRGGKADKTEKPDKAPKKSTAACGGWSSPKKSQPSVSSCGGAGWTRYGKLPSGC